MTGSTALPPRRLMVESAFGSHPICLTRLPRLAPAAAWFSREDMGDIPLFQILAQAFELRALSATVATLEGYKLSLHFATTLILSFSTPNRFEADCKAKRFSAVITSPFRNSGKQGGKSPHTAAETLPSASERGISFIEFSSKSCKSRGACTR